MKRTALLASALAALLLLIAPSPAAGLTPPTPAVAAPQAGHILVTERGATFTGQHFSRQVTVLADHVTFQGCTFDPEFRDLYAVKVGFIGDRSARFTRFVDCKITGAGKGIIGSWMSIEGCEFYGLSEDGVFVGIDGFVNIERSLFHMSVAVSPAHADGVQIMSGRYVRIARNEFRLPHDPDGFPISGSCIYMEPNWTPVSNVLIVGNILDGGLFSLWSYPGRKGTVENLVVRRNVFLRYFFGPYYVRGQGIVWQQNKVDTAYQWSGGE